MRLWVAFSGLILVFHAIDAVDGKKKSAKDWSSIDFDQIGEDWKDGDAEDELITEDELLYREMERRREEPIDVNGPLDPEVIRHQQSNAGPAMMFLELRKKDGGYGETELVDLGGIWKDLLFSGGIEVSFYNIEENRMLVSLQKGWDSMEVKNFLLEQKEIEKVTWDSIDYVSEDPPSEGPSVGKTRTAKKKKEQQEKKKSKKKKKKGKKRQG